jgi:hypothetical protein
VLETGKIELEMRWLCSAKVCSVWEHRTVRCARLARANWPLSGIHRRRTTIIHRTVRCAPDCPVSQRSAGQTVGCTICARHVAEPMVGRGHRTVRCAPDSVRCANGSQAPTVDYATEGKKSAPDSVRCAPDSVRCARRQKARIAFPDCSQQLLAALGL